MKYNQSLNIKDACEIVKSKYPDAPKRLDNIYSAVKREKIQINPRDPYEHKAKEALMAAAARLEQKS